MNEPFNKKQKHVSILKLVVSGILIIIFTGCQNSAENDSDKSTTKNDVSGTTADSAAKGGLTEWQHTNGIGPVTAPLDMASLADPALAAEGKTIFESKCAMCHKLNERYVGPPLNDALGKRSPEYIVNMIMNPLEMTSKHPEAKTMLGEYMNQMPFQNVTLDDAKKILGYLQSSKKSE